MPASKVTSSSRTITAASTASSAEPPLARTSRPRSRARVIPARQSATAASGMLHAPPWTMSEKFCEFTSEARAAKENAQQTQAPRLAVRVSRLRAGESGFWSEGGSPRNSERATSGDCVSLNGGPATTACSAERRFPSVSFQV